jgi:hypothetical protein
MTGSGAYWRCEVCHALVTGIKWNSATNGKGSHPDPKGGHCRVVNFTKVEPTETEKAGAVLFCDDDTSPISTPIA